MNYNASVTKNMEIILWNIALKEVFRKEIQKGSSTNYIIAKAQHRKREILRGY